MKNAKKVDGLEKLSPWESIYASHIAITVGQKVIKSIEKDEKLLKANKNKTIPQEDS